MIKTFRLETVAEDDRDDISSMNYHLNFDVEIKNLADQPQQLAYRVDGPNGLPTEDWWFAIKIHGEWAAVFTQAGAPRHRRQYGCQVLFTSLAAQTLHQWYQAQSASADSCDRPGQ